MPHDRVTTTVFLNCSRTLARVDSPFPHPNNTGRFLGNWYASYESRSYLAYGARCFRQYDAKEENLTWAGWAKFNCTVAAFDLPGTAHRAENRVSQRMGDQTSEKLWTRVKGWSSSRIQDRPCDTRIRLKNVTHTQEYSERSKSKSEVQVVTIRRPRLCSGTCAIGIIASRPVDSGVLE